MPLSNARKGPWLLLWLWMLCFSHESRAANSTAPANIVEIPAPCSIARPGAKKEGASGFLRKCTEVLEGVPGVSGYTGPTGAFRLIREEMTRLIDHPTHSLYRGHAVDPSSPDPANPSTASFGTPVCNLTPGPFNGVKSETETNHRGESCGKPSLFDVDVSSGGVNTTMFLSSQHGTLESAYFRGIWIQALTCFSEQVKREIEMSHKLKISASCQGMARKMEELGTSSESVARHLRDQLKGQNNISDIWKCEASQVTRSGAGFDVGGHRQSAQQLCTARAGIETLFTQIALCEIFTRAGRSFRNAIHDPDAFLSDIKKTVVSNCKSRCSSSCGDCGSASGCSKCGTDCANDCYTPELQNYILKKLRAWPNDGSCRL